MSVLKVFPPIIQLQNLMLQRFSTLGEKINEINITTLLSNVNVENLILKPGVNVVTLDTDAYHTITHAAKSESGVTYPKFLTTTLAFDVRSISIGN